MATFKSLKEYGDYQKQSALQEDRSLEGFDVTLGTALVIYVGPDERALLPDRWHMESVRELEDSAVELVLRAESKPNVSGSRFSFVNSGAAEKRSRLQFMKAVHPVIEALPCFKQTAVEARLSASKEKLFITIPGERTTYTPSTRRRAGAPPQERMTGFEAGLELDSLFRQINSLFEQYYDGTFGKLKMVVVDHDKNVVSFEAPVKLYGYIPFGIDSLES